MEAFYPPPGDARLKQHRSAVGKKSDGGATVTANEQSGDYEEYTRNDIIDQRVLDSTAHSAYEERKRQEMQGSFHTSELQALGKDGQMVNLLDMRAGDAIGIVMDTTDDQRQAILDIDDEEGRVAYLKNLGYDPDVAKLLAANVGDTDLNDNTFHIKSLEVDLKHDSFDLTVSYHNLIFVPSA